MATEPTPVWQPDWGVPPGEILIEVLNERDITQSELARRMDRPLKTINEIVKGKAAITPATAIQLERSLGISARFWNNLETNYREALARDQARQELENEVAWAQRFPLRELKRFGVLRSEASRAKADLVDELLRFFGVSNRTAWESQWLQPVAAFRSSRAFRAVPQSVAAWLRWGEVEAERIECRPYEAQRLIAVLNRIRDLTLVEPFSDALDQLRDLCADCGVAVVVTPELPGAPLSGATRWLTSEKALIQLSLRHKSDDQFWFTCLHEVGHVVLPSRRRDFLDPLVGKVDDPKAELEANEFARDVLVSAEDYEPFASRGDFSANSVRTFAQQLRVPPGILVGRLQRDGFLTQRQLNGLKRRIRWMLPPSVTDR